MTVTTNPVESFIAPMIDRYLTTLTTHQAVSSRIDRMLKANYWGSEDSAAFKVDIAYETTLREEIERAGQAIDVAQGMLTAIYGEREAFERYPNLWELKGGAE